MVNKNKKYNLGMPSLTDNNQKGVLYITFDVAFPKTALSEEQKQLIKDILKQDEVKPLNYNGLQGY